MNKAEQRKFDALMARIDTRPIRFVTSVVIGDSQHYSGTSDNWPVFDAADEAENTTAHERWVGDISWHKPWGKYAFFPRARTEFDENCLFDIAAFCLRPRFN